MSFSLVYMTATSLEEAQRIGRLLVEERLAACVNILPGMISLYHWQGAIETGNEVVLIAKTRSALCPQLAARVEELHSYTVPCILELPVTHGNHRFLDWLAQETERPQDAPRIGIAEDDAEDSPPEH